MTKWRWAAILVVGMLLLSVVPGEAGGRRHRHHGSRVVVGLGVGFGPAWWYHPYPYWYYPPPYVYAPPPTVVIQQPPVYVEQQPVPPVASAPAPPQQYWYYCQPSQGYYPNVQTCSEPWVKVPARSQ